MILTISKIGKLGPRALHEEHECLEANLPSLRIGANVYFSQFFGLIFYCKELSKYRDVK